MIKALNHVFFMLHFHLIVTALCKNENQIGLKFWTQHKFEQEPIHEYTFLKLINNSSSSIKKNHNLEGGLDTVLISIDFDDFTSPFTL